MEPSYLSNGPGLVECMLSKVKEETIEPDLSYLLDYAKELRAAGKDPRTIARQLRENLPSVLRSGLTLRIRRILRYAHFAAYLVRMQILRCLECGICAQWFENALDCKHNCHYSRISKIIINCPT